MAKNLEISERFTEMLDFLGMNAAQFSKRLNYDRAQTIYDIKKGGVNPSADFFIRFINTGFSEIINIEWLIAGKGPMKLEDKKEETEQTVTPDLLMNYLREKDKDIKKMAEEIGALKTQLQNIKRRYDLKEDNTLHVAEQHTRFSKAKK